MRGRGAAALAPGLVTLALLAGGVGAAFAALLWKAPLATLAALPADPYLWRVVRFTTWQASLSTLLSVALAVPVARALARRTRFPGRRALLALFGLPLVVPVIVAILGMVTVYGQNGWLNRALAALGLPGGRYLYGLSGILLAHVFFNLPLATRMLLYAWQAVPGESWRVASQLGMRSGQLWRLIEWPALRPVLPGVAGLVFLLCFTSFAVVLTLGGGPRSTTVEVAIYQALRLDFDLPRAVTLALVQLALCAGFVAFGQRLARPVPFAATEQRRLERPDLEAPLGRIADALVITAAGIFVALPLAAVLAAGLAGPLGAVLADAALWRAAARSLAVAGAAALGSLGIAWSLLAASRELRVRLQRPRGAEAIELAGSLVLVVSPIVLGAGLFVLLLPLVDVLAVGLYLVVTINALMGLPYMIRLLGPPLMRAAEHHDRLCASLGLGGWNRLRLVEWPLLRRPLGLALALSAALAVGDLGTIALFGTRDNATLPLLLYQRLGSYRLDEAAVTALVLLGLCLALFALLERGVGGRGER